MNVGAGGRLLLLFVVVGGLAVSSAFSQASGPPVQRDRIHLRASDWTPSAKTASEVRVGETVRLRDGATTGRVTSAPIALPFPVNGVGPHWDATVPQGAVLGVSLRASPNGVDWTSWVTPGHRTPVPATEEGTAAPNRYAGDTAGGLVLTESDTRYVQVRLRLRAGAEASPILRRLSLYVVNATDGPGRPSGVSGSGDPDTLKPDLSTRDEWGARAPRATYRYHPATHLAIHHTAGASAGAADTWEECAAAVRAIQDYHMDTNGWIDIGYNYLICQTGAIFQGREDGNDVRDVVGAHDGYNEGSVGTAAMGYFHPPENQRPSAALRDGYVDLFAWIAARRDIDPDGTERYPDYGPLRTVYGHRDVSATACPGDHLYPRRVDFVDRLAALVPNPPDATILSPNRPNPAGAETHFDLRLARGGVVTLTLYDLLGRRTLRRRFGYYGAGTHTITLQTNRLAAGTYPYRLVVDEQSRTGTLRVVR